MDYHLKPIEQFISTYLKPSQTLIDRLDSPIIEDIILKMIHEIEKAKTNISHSYLSYDEEKTGEQLIKNHQRRTVILINSVHKDIKKAAKQKSESKLRVQREVVDYLNGLLKYLEHEYTQCIDDSLFITTNIGNKKSQEFSVTTARFHESFYYSDTIVRIALEPIDTFISAEKTNYTYGQVNYLTRLTKEMDQLQRKVELGFKVELVNILTYINFNNNSFLDFLIKQIQKDVEKMDTVEEKLLKLKFHLKHHKQRITNTDIAFLPKRPNIKEQIISWINEEIKFLKSRKKLLKKDDRLGKPVVNNKFQLNISMEQLALLIRIGSDTDIIMIEDLSAFTKFISKYFSTKKKDNISSSSLRNRIYKYEIEDSNGLKADIINLINSYV